MLFSLSNIKRRSVRDADGELAVVPRLMHGRNVLKLVDQAIGVFEGYAGRSRSEYDPRALEAVMSDYRLARCVEACLLTYYSFVQPQLDSVLAPEQIAGLEGRELGGPSDLRLALWDAANGRYGGFVLPEDRSGLLRSLADEWGLPPDPQLIDTLLSLDSEGMAVLTPMRERPGPRDIMRQYNRGVVQTLLAHSTRVEFNVSKLPGAALKRLYFVAKRRGVLVEVEELTGRSGYALTLFGPEQAFGTADKYGQRLAEVALSLLRSLLSMEAITGELMDSAPAPEVGATAHLLLHDRPYRFHLTHDILTRLEFAPEPTGDKPRRVAETGVAYSVGSAVTGDEQEAVGEPSFDSMLEAALYREHKSLERQGYTHGWSLLREPDPLLAPGIVLIPDFAYERGDTRVFMEIAGFWSPSYRERKLSKLRTLAAREGESAALIVAVPKDAVTYFAGLPYPVIPYKNSLRVTDVLSVLDARYGGREERLESAGSQAGTLWAAASERGLVPESEVAQALQAYTRSELLTAARSLDGEGCRYVAGVGLLSEQALANTHAALQEALASAPEGRLSLEDASRVASSALGANVDVEALLQLWPEWRVDRPSLFEAYVVVGDK